MREWSVRRWVVAAVGAVGTVLVVAVPTAMIHTPVFGRAVAVTWWSWPVLLATAVLSGLLLATYVREPGLEPVVAGGGTTASQAPAGADRPSKLGMAGGALTFFAVGCPVCNKIALLALGSAGALQWFAPIQPVLAVGALALLAYSLRVRLRGERACPVAAPAVSAPTGATPADAPRR